MRVGPIGAAMGRLQLGEIGVGGQVAVGCALLALAALAVCPLRLARLGTWLARTLRLARASRLHRHVARVGPAGDVGAPRGLGLGSLAPRLVRSRRLPLLGGRGRPPLLAGARPVRATRRSGARVVLGGVAARARVAVGDGARVGPRLGRRASLGGAGLGGRVFESRVGPALGIRRLGFARAARARAGPRFLPGTCAGLGRLAARVGRRVRAGVWRVSALVRSSTVGRAQAAELRLGRRPLLRPPDPASLAPRHDPLGPLAAGRGHLPALAGRLVADLARGVAPALSALQAPAPQAHVAAVLPPQPGAVARLDPAQAPRRVVGVARLRPVGQGRSGEQTGVVVRELERATLARHARQVAGGVVLVRRPLAAAAAVDHGAQQPARVALVDHDRAVVPHPPHEPVAVVALEALAAPVLRLTRQQPIGVVVLEPARASLRVDEREQAAAVVPGRAPATALDPHRARVTARVVAFGTPRQPDLEPARAATVARHALGLERAPVCVAAAHDPTRRIEPEHGRRASSPAHAGVTRFDERLERRPLARAHRRAHPLPAPLQHHAQGPAAPDRGLELAALAAQVPVEADVRRERPRARQARHATARVVRDLEPAAPREAHARQPSGPVREPRDPAERILVLAEATLRVVAVLDRAPERIDRAAEPTALVLEPQRASSAVDHAHRDASRALDREREALGVVPLDQGAARVEHLAAPVAVDPHPGPVVAAS